jgi:hypothetical protein
MMSDERFMKRYNRWQKIGRLRTSVYASLSAGIAFSIVKSLMNAIGNVPYIHYFEREFISRQNLFSSLFYAIMMFFFIYFYSWGAMDKANKKKLAKREVEKGSAVL